MWHNGAMTDLSVAGALPIVAIAGDAVVHVEPDATLVEVARVLTDRAIGAVAVSSDPDRVEGILTERDLVRAMAEAADPTAATAREIASTDLVWCDASATVAEVAELMMERYVRHVLVEDDAVLAGIVSARDLLGVYASGDLELE